MSGRTPSERAANALARRCHERQVQAAVRWLHENDGRKAADALKTGSFPLISTADALRQQASKRRPDGTLWVRDKQELLTSAEIDVLIRRYLDEGFVGACDGAALALLRRGVIEILESRPDPKFYTDSEMRLLRPGEKPVALATCQMWAEMAKIMLKEVSWPQSKISIHQPTSACTGSSLVCTDSCCR